jgi:ankyrin repeat protein
MKHEALLLLVFEVVICFLRRSPLHLSSEKGHLEVCKCLIAAQADVNAKNRVGYDFNCIRIFYEA